MAASVRHGQERISQEVVEDHQRRHMIAVVAQLVDQRGVEPNGEEIVAAARISRMSIYRLFGTKRGCIDAACTRATELLTQPLRAAAASDGAWPARLEAGIDGLLGAAAAEPQMAALCLIHSPGLVGAPLAAGPTAVQSALVTLLDGGREAGRAACRACYLEPAASAEVFVAAGIVAMLGHLVADRELEAGAERREEMVQFATSQFLS